ncbi:MAG: uroporphyrinogen decarboxylase family protein [Sedimentisphaeraceae bacterium JB056]
MSNQTELIPRKMPNDIIMLPKREQVIGVLRGEILDEIPIYNESAMDITVFNSLLPKSTGDFVTDVINITDFFHSSAIHLGIGLKREVLEKTEDVYRYRFETGAVWREEYSPTFCREAESYPINTPKDIFEFEMPDANDPDRFTDKDIQDLKAFKEAGYFVEASVIGAWYGMYYFLTSFENALLWMAIEPEAAHCMINKLKKFSLDSAVRLLEAGADAIFTPSDFGSGSSLLFSPAMFREYFSPWLRELADLCHQYGAFLHLHSHGYISPIMDLIVEAGVDMVNPIGPSDNNDLAEFKENWGDKITINGGVSTLINGMTDKEIEEHLKNVMAIGRKGGRFFPRTESGIPPIGTDKLKSYYDILLPLCREGYTA